MDWGKWAFWIAILDFVILVVMGFHFGSRLKYERERRYKMYREVRDDVNEITGEGTIERFRKREREKGR
jgi:hypothetical protein